WLMAHHGSDGASDGPSAELLKGNFPGDFWPTSLVEGDGTNSDLRECDGQSLKQVVQDSPSIVPTVVPTIALPTDVVIRLFNVLEALVPNHDGLPIPQTTSQAQTQVQLNVAATQAPQLIPQPIVHSVTTTEQSKDPKNFMDLKPQEFDGTPISIEP
ncbi:hypothetical protein HAX54_047317, partial [Datura stramonium]|nr:hypothetical protein [Datura stramonium]